AVPWLEQARRREQDRRGVEELRRPFERRVRVVIDAGRSELAALAPNVDGDPGLRRQLGLAPPHDVVLQGTCALVVRDGAMLKGDATPVREQPLVELPQALGTSVDVVGP